MIRTKGTKFIYYSLENFRTLLLTSHVYKTLVFHLKRLELSNYDTEQIGSNFNCGYLKWTTFLYSVLTSYVNSYKTSFIPFPKIT